MQMTLSSLYKDVCHSSKDDSDTILLLPIQYSFDPYNKWPEHCGYFEANLKHAITFGVTLGDKKGGQVSYPHSPTWTVYQGERNGEWGSK